MANLASVLKSEIRRLARAENRSDNALLKKQAAQYRRDIAALKRQVATLQRDVSFLKKQEGRRVAEKPDESVAASVRFSPSWVKKHRDKLGLSAENYGKLVGVSALTIYNWESGKSKPRARQLAAWAAVRGLGKREGMKRLELLER